MSASAGSGAEATSRPPHGARRAVAITCLLGFLLTAVAAWTADHVDDSTEERLLETQTRQAAAVLSVAVMAIDQQVTTALRVQAAAGPDGDPSVFRRGFGASVGPDETFVSASLWRRDGTRTERVASLGARPAMAPGSAETRAFLDRAVAASTTVIEPVEVGDRLRLVYGLADPSGDFVIYAERPLPADRRAPVDRDSAFSHLDYAIYFGDSTSSADLATTDVDPAGLPLAEPSSKTTLPFGDTGLTLVARPSGHLGSQLSQWLPLIVLLGGILLTLGTALITRRFVRARMQAESDADTIGVLYQRINGLYEEQRTVSERLQRALLPQTFPDVPELEVASTYVAGTKGIEIGGDWYSLVDVDEDRFGFVVGDVSGRGVDAVAVMARARFTLRAYLLDGNSPQEALEKCARQFDIAVDEHMFTAVVGVGTWRTGEVVIANAGHPLPVLVVDGRAALVPMPVGPPLGTGVWSYESTTFTMPPGSTLVGFTDGLVERRDEDIDAGMQRLLDAAAQHAVAPVEELPRLLLGEMHGEDADDDIAVLALRRTTPAGAKAPDRLQTAGA